MKKQIKWMIKYAFIVSCTVLSTLSAVAATHAAQSLDQIAVVVNEGVITESDVNHAMKTLTQELAASNMPLPPEKQLRQQALDQLINRKLQFELAKQAGITISDAALNKAIQQIADGNHVSVKELYERVATQGITKTDYRKEIRDELLLRTIQQQEVGPKVSITPQEVDEFIHSNAWKTPGTKEYHLEDIVVPLPENPSPNAIAAATQQANAILIKWRQGVRFNQLTTAASSDSNALQGEDLGWRQLSEIPTAFVNPVMQLKVNEVSEPIQTPNGVHILHVAAIREINPTASVVPQKKQMEQLLFQRKYQEASQAWIAKLRSEAVITMNP